MKSNIKVIQAPSAKTWKAVAAEAAQLLSADLDFVKADPSNQIHLVLPSGNGLIFDQLTDGSFAAMPGLGWDHFDEYGLRQDGDGAIIWASDMAEPKSINPRAEQRIGLVLKRAHRG